MASMAFALKERRENAGFSIQRVAFELKISEETLMRWEQGKANPDPDQALALASLYHCRLEDLVLGDEKKAKKKKEKRGAKSDTGQYAVLVTAAYLILGAVCGLWHPGWMVFLCIPLCSLPDEVKNSWRILGNPVMTTILYLSLGFLLNLWHPGWLIFLLIPGIPALEKYLSKNQDDE